LATLLLTGCSQGTQPAPAADNEAKEEAPKPVEPVTAKTALWPMYMSARSWATDFVILKIDPKEIPGYKNDPGKAAMWEVTFASPSRKEYRVYSYAIAAHAPDIYKGVVVGRAIPCNGPTRDVMPVKLSEFNADSDAAYKAAASDAESWLKKNPDKGLSQVALGNAYRFGEPVWFFQWGNKKSGHVAIVDANSGKLVKK
jgi:hypothetical protein